MSENRPPIVYKILSADAQAVGGNRVPRMPIDIADGYIHLSTAEQLRETLALHFKGQSDLTVLAIRTADVEPDLRWEPSRGGQLFPHVYGEIPVSAVEKEARLDVTADGTTVLPPELS